MFNEKLEQEFKVVVAERSRICGGNANRRL